MQNFYKENQKWITPALAMLLAVLAPSVAALTGTSILLPSWFFSLVLILGMLSAGYGAYITNTLAARIVLIVIPAFLLALAAFKIFG